MWHTVLMVFVITYGSAYGVLVALPKDKPKKRHETHEEELSCWPC